VNRSMRNAVIGILGSLALSAPSFALATATVTMTGGETQEFDQSWDIGPLMVTVNVSGISYIETVYYGQYSTTASVASEIAGRFSNDYAQNGLCAHASGATITFNLTATGAAFGLLNVSGPTSSFQLNGAGFAAYTIAPPSNGGSLTVSTLNMAGGQDAGTYYDQGTVSVRVSGATAAAEWSEGSTPAGMASELASAINMAAGGFVSANASGATISVTSLNGGPATDMSIAGSTIDSADTGYFSSPSFSVATTNMSGGGATEGDLLYGFTIPDQGGYDLNGNLLTAVDSVMGTWSYSYDNLNRLANSAGSQPNNPITNYCWVYDQFGNRTVQSGAGGSAVFEGGSGNPCQLESGTLYTNAWMTPTANNQMSSSSQSVASGIPIQYDAAGNMTGDGQNQYLYDAEERLCAVKNSGGSMTGYIYDVGGIRVAKGSLNSFSCNFAPSNFTANTSWVLGQGGEQVTEYSVSGGPGSYASTWAHSNVFASGALMATYAASGSNQFPNGDTYFALSDWLGTKRAEVSAGRCFSSFASMPFGDALTPNGNCADATEHHYTGKERDTESGNDYFGARYYASSMGRFMSPDWSAKEEPVPYAKLDNPQSLNLYSYVLNNPLSNVDTDGHACGGLYFNSGSGFCTRATEYGQIDAISGVQSQTRFFAAANAVSQALADVATPVSGLLVSGQTANFLEGVGQNLQKLNQTEAAAIQNGSLSGPNLDGQLVHNEQSSVQGQLNSFQQSDPTGYTKAIGEINGSLNSTATQVLEQLRGTDRAYAGVLAGVRKDLGRNIDFSKQGDREAIGNALIKHIRQTGGCDVNGKKQAGC
jgi:RHS repeat-associated protein